MLSGIVTAALLVMFVIGCVWVFSPRRRRDFDEAARLPLNEEDVGSEQGDAR